MTETTEEAARERAVEPRAEPGEPADGGEASPFAKLSRSKVAKVLNCLTEAPFFYRDDDPDLFDYLRKNRLAFERFLDEHFAWTLHVDRKCARIFRRMQANPALTPKQRDVFELTRREECLLFMLLLEFHERELAAQNVHYEHDEDLRFVFADFVVHARGRFRQELGEATPGDRELLLHAQALFRELERFRFVKLVEKQDAATGEDAAGLEAHLLYEFLPGMHCYDPGRLSREIFLRAYGLGGAEAGTPAPAGDAAAPDTGVVGEPAGDTDGAELAGATGALAAAGAPGEPEPVGAALDAGEPGPGEGDPS